MSRRGVVQTAHVGVAAIEEDAVRLVGGQQRAVLEVGSLNFGLQGEREQEPILASFAAFFLMWGAFLYMSAAGSPHQMERGKSAMVNALAGLAIVLSARVIAGLLQSALGAGH